MTEPKRNRMPTRDGEIDRDARVKWATASACPTDAWQGGAKLNAQNGGLKLTFADLFGARGRLDGKYIKGWRGEGVARQIHELLVGIDLVLRQAVVRVIAPRAWEFIRFERRSKGDEDQRDD